MTQEKEPTEDVLMIYPAKALKKTIPSGVVNIDFFEGFVEASDTKTENLSRGLKLTGKKGVRSLLIKTDSAVNITIDEKGTRVINGNFMLRKVLVRKLALEANTLGGSFGFSILASTDPSAEFSDNTSI